MTPAPSPASVLLPADVLDRTAQVASQLSESLTDPPPDRFGADHGPRSRRWWDQSLSKGAAGVAVLHSVREHPDLVHRWLIRAVHEDISTAAGCGLWFGAPAVAFAVHLATQDTSTGRYRSEAAALDTAVAGLVRCRLDAAAARIDAAARPSLSEFDLVRGLSGLGAYLLSRDPGGELLRRVLGYLVRLTEPLPARDPAGPDVPGWWTSDIPAGPGADVFQDGHADLGMAHGVSGPLALLSLAARNHIDVPGQAEAIQRICAWLDRWRQHDPSAGTWWPQRITLTELRTGRSTQQGPGRPSWCYGTPGLARAQQLAGLALDDTDRQDVAEQALLRCLTDPAQLGELVDTTLCHGWAGVAATAWCAARDARDPALAAHLPHLIDQMITHVDEPSVDAPNGLIDGAAGLAATLHTIATGTSDSWTRCLLLA